MSGVRWELRTAGLQSSHVSISDSKYWRGNISWIFNLVKDCLPLKQFSNVNNVRRGPAVWTQHSLGLVHNNWLLTLPCTGGGRFPPPLPTLKPHSSLRSLSLCPIFISTWSHGHPLWPWLKKSTKKSFVFELYNLWRNDQKSPYNVGLKDMAVIVIFVEFFWNFFFIFELNNLWQNDQKSPCKVEKD